jgi:hypothetical protein
MTESPYNKTIIEIDSTNATFNGNVCDFYVDILEPLKNVKCIKLIRSSVTIKPKQQLAGSAIVDDDPIYVIMNGYNRLSSVVNGSIIDSFEMLLLSLTKSYGITNSTSFTSTSSVTYMNEYTHSFQEDDISVHVLNPCEPTLKRFNIQLVNKANKVIPKADVDRFKMILCIYTLKTGYI